MPIDSPEQYRQDRDALLGRIVSELSVDPRFEAAWLWGSLGRGQGDAVSDLDLRFAVSDGAVAALCERPAMIAARPVGARLALFERFGEIATLYENHHNAPGHGTSSGVLFASGVMVDWMLVPAAEARRPIAALTLFEHRAFAADEPPPAETEHDRLQLAADTTAFFWMMAAITAKYALRGDDAYVTIWLEALTKMVEEIESLVQGRPLEYRRGMRTALQAQRSDRLRLLRELAGRVERSGQDLADRGGLVWPDAAGGFERMLRLAEQSAGEP